MTNAKKFLLGVLAAGLIAGLLITAWAWRRASRHQPPEPSAFSLQLATQMVGATFRAPGLELDLPYRLYVPEPLEPGRRYPLIVYLHGAGDNGNDNVRQLGPLVAQLIQQAKSAEPAFILAPQSPLGKTWVPVPGAPYLNYSQQALPESEAIQVTRALVAQLPGRYPIDPQREYLLGFSAGSAGSWDLLTRSPGHPYAAAAMLSGAYDPSRAATVAALPLWFFHGEKDEVSPYATALETVQALRQAGGSPRYTLVEGGGHDTNEAAVQAGVYAWLLSQRRAAAPAPQTSTPLSRAPA